MRLFVGEGLDPPLGITMIALCVLSDNVPFPDKSEHFRPVRCREGQDPPLQESFAAARQTAI